MAAIGSLELQLRLASSNTTALQRQQARLVESVHTLIHMVTTATGPCPPPPLRLPAHVARLLAIYRVLAGSPPQIQLWRDCADVYRAGHALSGLYHIYVSNRSEPVQVRPT